uniref:30S ribosomal protein S4e n=1 Tax=Lygus hesperus TaxID=30085 RepID=A0A0A9Y5B2_LYGHE
MAFVGKVDVKQHCATWTVVEMGELMNIKDLKSEIFSIPALGETARFHIKANFFFKDCDVELLCLEEERDKILSYRISGPIRPQEDTFETRGTLQISKMDEIPQPGVLSYEDASWRSLIVIGRGDSELVVWDDKARLHVKLWPAGTPEPECSHPV